MKVSIGAYNLATKLRPLHPQWFGIDCDVGLVLCHSEIVPLHAPRISSMERHIEIREEHRQNHVYLHVSKAMMRDCLAFHGVVIRKI